MIQPLWRVLFWLICAAVATPALGQEFMFRTKVDGLWIEGRPLAWDATSMVLLARDGQVHTFDPRRAKESRKTAPKFSGLPVEQVRQQLRGEFDGRYKMTSTQHYVVVHPRDRGNQWAGRFEQLYRDCRRWLRVRGFAADEPPFPLVAIVLPSESEYLGYAAETGQKVSPGTLGHYDPVTNRVLLFDDGAQGAGWEQTYATVIHEATHQTAFNVGVHTRLAESPQWVVEGLATLFEARGTYRAEAGDTIADRINNGRLADWRRLSRSRKQGTLQNLVASDVLFRASASRAYAEAWALTLYLSETRARDYARYLQTTGQRKVGKRYTPQQRLADFSQAFGGDLELLEANFLRWMNELP